MPPHKCIFHKTQASPEFDPDLFSFLTPAGEAQKGDMIALSLLCRQNESGDLEFQSPPNGIIKIDTGLDDLAWNKMTEDDKRSAAYAAFFILAHNKKTCFLNTTVSPARDEYDLFEIWIYRAGHIVFPQEIDDLLTYGSGDVSASWCDYKGRSAHEEILLKGPQMDMMKCVRECYP